jgi:hypothetical protein
MVEAYVSGIIFFYLKISELRYVLYRKYLQSLRYRTSIASFFLFNVYYSI